MSKTGSMLDTLTKKKGTVTESVQTEAPAPVVETPPARAEAPVGRRGRRKRRLTESDDRVVQTTVPFDTYIILNTIAMKEGTPLRNLVREALVMILNKHGERTSELQQMIKQLDGQASD